MDGYYVEKLSGERLLRCYEIASPRVQQYLEAEIQFVLQHLERTDSVLELGCGYGRVTSRLAKVASRVVGIDNSRESLELARRMSGSDTKCEYYEMDASALTFDDTEFDKVICVQNGICAFGVDHELLLRQALRVTKPGGSQYFSSYSEKFWKHRLLWFEAQAAAGLLGEIDYTRTGNGEIVCKDGFRTGFKTPEGFRSLCSKLNLDPEIIEVDGSSVFCEIVVPEVV
ncbi:MAG: methyltransferase domain-containing protein [Candidatus Aminicenantes bacterium]|nr:methyltransferase domain-containing protein [Candidatus Aminicenantes bacterium]